MCILIFNDYLILSLLLRSWTSAIIVHFHHSMLQDDIFLSCWSAGRGMCASGGDVQHLTIWVKLFKSRRILIRNDYLILSLLLRSWTSAIIALIHQSTLQDDIFLSCWSAGRGMCAAGGDVQHLAGSADLFNHGIFLARCFFNSLTAFKILNISDYLHTFTNQRFRMTVVMQKRKPHAAFLRSWTSAIIAHLHY